MYLRYLMYAPPIPNTKITEAIIKLRFLSKIYLLSTSILKPDEAIIPNNRIEIPPITGVGILEIKSVDFTNKAKDYRENCCTSNYIYAKHVCDR